MTGSRFRKRPVVVEAAQWHGPRTDGPTPTPAGVYRADGDGSGEDVFYVVTIHGQRTPIVPGDWVIVESRQPTPGLVHAYPCKPDVFAATYEPLE